MNRLALAIARDRADLPDLDGIDRYRSRGLAILHTQAPADVLAPGLETLQAYAATIASLHARETVLPLRFGSLHDSSASLDDWLRVRSDEWHGLLDEVEGCDEMGIRILLDASPDSGREPPPTCADRPGTSYLQALKARHAVSDALLAEASRLTERLKDGLVGTFRRSTVETPGPGRERLLSMTYLVPRPALDRFRSAVVPLGHQVPGKLLLTGPWPPYHFAGSDEIRL